MAFASPQVDAGGRSGFWSAWRSAALRGVAWAGVWAGLALLAGPRTAAAEGGAGVTPASEIPLKGPYRYDRGWYHKVALGDTLPVLANRFGVELKYLAKVNGLKDDSFLKMGTYVYVPPHSGYYHRVVSGDTLSALARRFHLDIEYLAATNRIAPTARLRAGEALIVPTRTRPAPVPGQPKTSPGARTGMPSSRSPTSTSTKSSSKSSSGSSSVSRSSSGSKSGSSSKSSSGKSGGSGKSSVAGMVDMPSREVKAPPSKPVSESARESASRRESSPSGSSDSNRSGSGSGSSSSGSSARGSISRRRSSDGRPTLQWPLEGKVMRGYVNTSDKKHRGVDIAAPIGTPIRAAADGTVIYSGSDIPGYGNMVIVDHGRGWATCYAHNSSNLVKMDQRVGAGQTIAKVGETGQATGPHCHFEVRHKYEAVDPMPLLP